MDETTTIYEPEQVFKQNKPQKQYFQTNKGIYDDNFIRRFVLFVINRCFPVPNYSKIVDDITLAIECSKSSQIRKDKNVQDITRDSEESKQSESCIPTDKNVQDIASDSEIKTSEQRVDSTTHATSHKVVKKTKILLLDVTMATIDTTVVHIKIKPSKFYNPVRPPATVSTLNGHQICMRAPFWDHEYLMESSRSHLSNGSSFITKFHPSRPKSQKEGVASPIMGLWACNFVWDPGPSGAHVGCAPTRWSMTLGSP
ncbi:OSJNBa0042P21.13 [Oryza sativa (japonica cultivar-group)]